jgi:hypothetical protein
MILLPTLKMAAVCFSETTYLTIQCHNPKISIFSIVHTSSSDQIYNLSITVNVTYDKVART